MSRGAWRRYVAECVGTFVLVAIGCGAAMVASRTHAFGHAAVALAFGLAVTIAVASTGHLGGAHINPAVTLGFWSVRRFSGREVIPYIVVQCVGAVGASVVLAWLLGSNGGVGETIPLIAVPQSFVTELGMTAILGFVIMAVATDERSSPGVAPFAIGATVFAGALVTGPLTGGSFNPARSFGPAVVSGVWTAQWLYWVAPIVGMMMGIRLYEVLRTADSVRSVERELGTVGPISS